MLSLSFVKVRPRSEVLEQEQTNLMLGGQVCVCVCRAQCALKYQEVWVHFKIIFWGDHLLLFFLGGGGGGS